MLGMSRGEIIFLSMILVLVFGWAGIPRLGARIGGMFEKR
jgi:hypothetical protein